MINSNIHYQGKLSTIISTVTSITIVEYDYVLIAEINVFAANSGYIYIFYKQNYNNNTIEIYLLLLFYKYMINNLSISHHMYDT